MSKSVYIELEKRETCGCNFTPVVGWTAEHVAEKYNDAYLAFLDDGTTDLVLGGKTIAVCGDWDVVDFDEDFNVCTVVDA